MLIPFATPENNLIVNISHIVNMKIVANCSKETGGILSVTFTDGVTRQFTDRAAHLLYLEVTFALTTYRDFQTASQSSILGANGNMPGRIM